MEAVSSSGNFVALEPYRSKYTMGTSGNTNIFREINTILASSIVKADKTLFTYLETQRQWLADNQGVWLPKNMPKELTVGMPEEKTLEINKLFMDCLEGLIVLGGVEGCEEEEEVKLVKRAEILTLQLGRIKA